MKDIPIEELEAISPEIFADAQRVGCRDVRITGKVWPGGQMSGPPERALRLVEYSWLKAAVVGGAPVFEADDPRTFAALLRTYGLGDEEAYTEPSGAAEELPAPAEPVLPRETLVAQVTAVTKHELERQALAAGITVGEYLDYKFGRVGEAE